MRYMLLIYDSEAKASKTADDDFPHWMEYTKKLEKSGKMLGSAALKPTTTATTVNSQKGKIMLTDGPFAETKEQLVGYYMIESKDIDEAIEWAGQMPHIERGRVEVRPIMEFD